jgi:hypothetical protein
MVDSICTDGRRRGYARADAVTRQRPARTAGRLSRTRPTAALPPYLTGPSQQSWAAGRPKSGEGHATGPISRGFPLHQPMAGPPPSFAGEDWELDPNRKIAHRPRNLRARLFAPPNFSGYTHALPDPSPACPAGAFHARLCRADPCSGRRAGATGARPRSAGLRPDRFGQDRRLRPCHGGHPACPGRGADTGHRAGFADHRPHAPGCASRPASAGWMLRRSAAT